MYNELISIVICLCLLTLRSNGTNNALVSIMITAIEDYMNFIFRHNIILMKICQYPILEFEFD